MLRNSTVLEGALPKAENELTAQQWVLEAIGVEPKSGQAVTLTLEDENGMTEIFVPYNDAKQQHPIVNLDIDEKYDLLESLQSIDEKLTSKDAFYEYSSEAGAMRRQRAALTGKQWGKKLFAAGRDYGRLQRG